MVHKNGVKAMIENVMDASNQLGAFRPIEACRHMRVLLERVCKCARVDMTRVSDPQTRALLETTADVLHQLSGTYEVFERRAARPRRAA